VGGGERERERDREREREIILAHQNTSLESVKNFLIEHQLGEKRKFSPVATAPVFSEGQYRKYQNPTFHSSSE
jgi:hypothetical protein